jgi:hypothetical protein
MPREIEAHHSVVGSKVLYLSVPITAVATPAMDEHQRNGSVSLHVVMNGKAISGDGNMALCIHG